MELPNHLTNTNRVTRGTTINTIRPETNERQNNLQTNSINKLSNNLSNNVCNIAQSTYSLTLLCIGLGIMITGALAWHEAVKYFIVRSIKFNQGTSTYYIYYALAITTFGALFFTVSKKYLDKNV